MGEIKLSDAEDGVFYHEILVRIDQMIRDLTCLEPITGPQFLERRRTLVNKLGELTQLMMERWVR